MSIKNYFKKPKYDVGSEKAKTDYKKARLLPSMRLFMAFLVFFGYFLNFSQKVDTGIAIVCMVNQTALDLKTTTTTVSLISNLTNSTKTTSNTSTSSQDSCQKVSAHSQDGPFVWDKNIQGIILSAYFYGYITTQLLGGWLSFKIGGKKVLCISMFIGSSITLIIPVLARWDYRAMIVGLALGGAAHGLFWPSVSSFWTYWAPSTDRSILVGSSSSGSRVGNIFTYILGGFLCVSGFDGGWASIYYIIGILGVSWSILFFILSSDSPKDHLLISTKEKIYVTEETRKAIETRKLCQSRVPWRKILTCKACYSIFIGHFAHNWGNYLFLTSTPSYLKDVLKFDVKSSGLITSIPYIVSWAAITLSSIISDRLLSANLLSRRTVRRIFSGIGTITPGVIIIGLSFLNCSQVVLAIVLLSVGIGLDSIMTGAGYLVNINDIAGPYSGIVYGVSNTLGTIPGIVGPYVASALTPDRTQAEWRIVFLICAGIYFVCGTINLILLEADLQPWAMIGPISNYDQVDDKEPTDKNPTSDIQK